MIVWQRDIDLIDKNEQEYNQNLLNKFNYLHQYH